MQLGMYGLGRMGGNMARRLLRAGHQLVAYNRSAGPVQQLAHEGAQAASSLAGLVQKLIPPRAVWLMLPAGPVTENAVRELGTLLAAGDVVIEGGNSFYKDDSRRAAELLPKGISYVDVGVSGGVWGLERGYCLMIGGPVDAARRLEPLFAALAPGMGGLPATAGAKSTAAHGYLHCGPAGAGHYVKMIHNGIEYGLMQAYAEGFELLRAMNADVLPAEQRYDLPLGEIAELWRRGSVISSWLLDLAARALLDSPGLSEFTGHVSDSGEGRWTVQTAVDLGVPAEIISLALLRRFRSRQDKSFADQLLSALRKQFGGHGEK
jgi:6-phosphogluconate dehydrogenase